MKRTVRLAVASLLIAAASTLGIAAPASAAGATVDGLITCDGVAIGTNGMAALYSWDGSNASQQYQASTNVSGVFSIPNVVAGTYLLQYSDGRVGDDARCAMEWFGSGHAYTRAAAQGFVVPASGTVTVSESLLRGAHADLHAVYGPSQLAAASTAVFFGLADPYTIDVLGSTDGIGNAHLTGLIPGGTRVYGTYPGYPPEFYSDLGSFTGADLVTAGSGLAAPALSVWFTSSGPSLTFFTDVPSSSAFYSAITWMGVNRISTGTAQQYQRPLYKPLDAVSRQAMALFLFRASGDSEGYSGSLTPHYADVPANSPYFAAAQWMWEKGISEGTPQPSGLPLYQPLQPVSRQSMAVFLFRLSATVAPTTTQHFADVPPGSSVFQAVQWMYEAGISTGSAQPSGLPLYNPSASVSRQAMAQFLYRLFGSG